MLNAIPAATGRLLISEPFMADPNFKRSVVLLTEYSAGGAVGFVLNHRSDLLLGDILPDLAYSEHAVFEGGPVAENTLHFIHRCPEKIPGGIPITTDIYWGGDFETVKELINSYSLADHEIKFFAGYSGWGEGQLDAELNDDAWIVTSQFDADILFADNDQTLWRQAVIGLGQRYAHIANFPENPSWN
jgi:putative transcriptional regulator